LIDNAISDLKISTIAHDNLSVSGILVNSTILKIEMISLSGEIKQSNVYSISEGVFELKQPIENITNGIYLIRISSENFIINEKVIVQ